MVLLLALLHLLLPPVWIFGGYLMRTAEMRDELPKLKEARVRRIDRMARNGETWLLLGDDGQLMEGRWYTPSRSARVFGGKASDYAASWVGWDGEEVSFQPVAYTAPLIIPQPGAPS